MQGEVEAVTGGRRMAEIMNAVEEELSRLVTIKTGKPKTGERYAAAIAERERLEAEERRVAARSRPCESPGQARGGCEAAGRLDRPEERQERQKAIDAAEAAFAAAKAQGDALRARRRPSCG